MRELKFRAWIPTGLLGLELGHEMFSSDDKDESTPSIIEDFEQFKDENSALMQFTGIKDKNGIEIYEGDIVNIWFNKAQKLRMVEVECFNLGSLNITNMSEPLYDRLGDEKQYRDTPYDFEVIGNIYENPELLK